MQALRRITCPSTSPPSIILAESRRGSVRIQDQLPSQDMLQGLLASGTFSTFMFNMYQEVIVEVKDGYWAEKFPLSNNVPEGSRFTISRTSSWALHVQIEGEPDAIEIAQGMTYSFELRNGRWHVMDVQSSGSGVVPQAQPPIAQQAAPQSQGLDVPQSEIFQRRKWFAVKLDNDWYAATPSSRYKEQHLYVRFDPENNCSGYVGYSYSGNGNPPQTGPFNQGIKLDTGRNTWTVDAGKAYLRYDTPSDTVLVEFDANMKFIAALAKKNSVKIAFGNSGGYYDDLSLSGSWASIVWALDRCKADFTTTPFAQPPAAPAPPITTQPPVSQNQQGFCGVCRPPRETTRNQLEQVARFDGQGADGYMSNYTFMNNLGDWPYQCNGPNCYLDTDESGQSQTGSIQYTGGSDQSVQSGPDGYCWARGYTADHLTQNPQQVVSTMWLDFDGDPWAGRKVMATMAVLSSHAPNLIRFGNADQYFTQGFFCFNDNGRMACAADSDAGRMELVPVDAKTLDVRTNFLAVIGDRENSIDLAEVPGEYVTYRLSRFPSDVCRNRK